MTNMEYSYQKPAVAAMMPCRYACALHWRKDRQKRQRRAADLVGGEVLGEGGQGAGDAGDAVGGGLRVRVVLARVCRQPVVLQGRPVQRAVRSELLRLPGACGAEGAGRSAVCRGRLTIASEQTADAASSSHCHVCASCRQSALQSGGGLRLGQLAHARVAVRLCRQAPKRRVWCGDTQQLFASI